MTINVACPALQLLPPSQAFPAERGVQQSRPSAERDQDDLETSAERERGVMGRRKIGREMPAKSCIDDLCM